MIIPLTSDTVWQKHLSQARPLELPNDPVLVIAPHPDDETLGAGALIASLRKRGVPVSIVAITDGENAYDTSPEERSALAHTREREQIEALAVLGVEPDMVHRLHLSDSGLADEEQTLTQRILEIAQPGMVLLAPWSGDFHPDHEACARAAAAVARQKKLTLLSYFFWTWHRGTPELLDGLAIRRFDPDTDTLVAKASALTKHVSQLKRDGGDPILPERLLGPARWPFEVFVSHE